MRRHTKLNDTKNSDIPGNELNECGLLSLFGAPGNFLNFRLCEIQLGAQCLLGEHKDHSRFFRSQLVFS